jgi:DNA-binding NarL/FixJ family response regulator
METDHIRVLLVDDEPAIRKGLRMQLELEPDISVVGEADDGDRVLEQADAFGADLVVMDIQMRSVDGISATVALQRERPALPIVILSLHDSLRMRSAALSAGAKAFVSKHEPAGVLLAAIRRVANELPRESEEER